MESNQVTLERAIRRINARAWGIAIGLVSGFGLLLATNILILKGGPNVGQHLRLLKVYFPGYDVTVVGSLIGFIYAFVVGYGVGRLVGMVYNRVSS